MKTIGDRTTGITPRAPVRIIVADDSAEIRKRVRAILEAYGADEVVEVADGLEAIEETQRLRPDLVVMDIRMPGMGGLEALPSLKALSPAPLVAILTGHAHSAYASRCAALGADYFLDKATGLAQLHEIVRGLAKVESADAR